MNQSNSISRFSDSSDELEKTRLLKHIKKDNTTEWMPIDVKQILGIETMPVWYLDTSNTQFICDDLTASMYSGFTVINKGDVKFVCLTTIDTIHVIDLSKEDHVNFLKEQLIREDVNFFIIDGTKNAHLLSRQYGIKLTGRHIDLTTFDVHIVLRSKFMSTKPPEGRFTTRYVHDTLQPKQLSYIELANKWLNARIDLCTDEEYRSLVDSPHCFDIQAGNLIRKQAALVRAIGVRMKEEFDNMRFAISRRIISFGVRVNDDIREDYDRRDDKTIEHMDFCLNR